MKCLQARLAAAVLVLGGAAYGTDTELTGYARPDQQSLNTTTLAIENPHFEKDGAGWTMRPGVVIERGSGRSGTHALKYTRTNAKDYQLVSTPLQLKPGAFYRFGAWIKTDQVTPSPQGGGATVALEFYRTGVDGKKVFITGRYLKGLTGTKDWTLISDLVRIPAGTTNASLALYLWKDATGTAWYDDVMIQEQGFNLWSANTLNPYNTVTDGNCTVAVSYNGSSAMKQTAPGALALQLQLKQPRRAWRTPVKDDRAAFQLTNLPDGSYPAELLVLDTVGKKVLFSTTLPLTVQTGSHATVQLDSLGRTWISGRPFMPIGVFTAGLDAAIMDTLLEAGLNCVLPYSSMAMRLNAKAKSSPEEIVKVMDLAAAKGLKVIFSGKDIGSTARHGLQEWQGVKGQSAIVAKITALLKNHPALLAWYINDEQPSSQLQRLTAMRRQFNTADPNHPTYGTLYQFEDLPLYGPTCDIIGVDPYPLHGQELKKAVFAMAQTRQTGLPVWVVPQISNLKIYYHDGKVSEPNPTEEQMRSLVLLEAALGAKGFIFYKFEDLKSWKLPKDNFVREWTKVKNVVKMLRELEPYIMSGKIPEVLLRGPVVAVRLQNAAGKSAVLLIGVEAGKTTATLQLNGQYQSRYGRTKVQDGKWIFNGQDISSDLLFER